MYTNTDNLRWVTLPLDGTDEWAGTEVKRWLYWIIKTELMPLVGLILWQMSSRLHKRKCYSCHILCSASLFTSWTESSLPLWILALSHRVHTVHTGSGTCSSRFAFQSPMTMLCVATLQPERIERVITFCRGTQRTCIFSVKLSLVHSWLFHETGCDIGREYK